MNIFYVKKTETAKKTPAIIIDLNAEYQGIEILVDFVKHIRPRNYHNYREATLKFKALLYHLQQDKGLLYSIRKALIHFFSNGNIVPALTESGMVRSRGFLQEMLIKVQHKVLPPLLQENDFLYVINHVFYKKTDYLWVENIDRELWINFFEMLGISINLDEPLLLQQLNQAVHILSVRTVTLGLENELLRTLPDVAYTDYAFVKLDKAVQSYLQLNERDIDTLLLKEGVRNIVHILDECKQTLELISEERKKKGTSLSQTFILFRLQKHLERLYLLTDFIDNDRQFNTERFLDYFTKVIHYEKRKSSLREFISANFSFIAYQITEHSSKRGIHYITATRKEFWWLLKSAMGGGIIISFTAAIKNILTKLHLAPFWQAFAYSMNYFVGFQVMYETHTTLATKQPAYTASAIAQSFDSIKNNGRVDLHSLAITIARTSRSQIASFFGNLIMVFPLSFLLAGLYHAVTGSFLVGGEAAHHLLAEQHPLQSFSLLYACFTGFFLFVSGLIAGYVENHINYEKVGERLRHHPLFKNTLPAKRLKRLTSYVENNMGALAGNLSLGFFLGMAGFIGKTFGIPFDIRHITIAAGNSAIAFFAVGKQEPTIFLLNVLAGVLMIGLLNFLVSFALAFLVAARSRGIRLKDYPDFIIILGRYLRRYPADFIRPPKKLREPWQIMKVRSKVFTG